MLAAEIAERLGISLDSFYKKRETLHMIDGMPRSIVSAGHKRYDRASMEAWLTRFHPMRPPAPANDPLAHPAPAAVDEHRARLARAYPPRKPEKTASPPLDRPLCTALQAAE